MKGEDAMWIKNSNSKIKLKMIGLFELAYQPAWPGSGDKLLEYNIICISCTIDRVD